MKITQYICYDNGAGWCFGSAGFLAEQSAATGYVKLEGVPEKLFIPT